MYGIDVSNWQAGMSLPESLDFCIAKATEGFRYTDPTFHSFMAQCKRKGILYGFYHFARSGSPEDNANHFFEVVEPYNQEGVPVLDIEDDAIPDWGEYAQRFIDRYHAISGVYPMIYASASQLPRFEGYKVCEQCGLWCAGYPTNEVLDIGDLPCDFPYDIGPFDFVSIWQYTDHGNVPGYTDQDLNVAYMDRAAWGKYANPNKIDHTSELPTVTDPAQPKRKWTFENSALKVDVELK